MEASRSFARRSSALNEASCGAACSPKGKAKTAIDVQELATLFKALAHPARIGILRHLSSHGTCYFGSLSEVVGLAPSTTSEHVKILKEAGLVIGSAEDQRTCYCVNPKRLAALKQLVGGL